MRLGEFVEFLGHLGVLGLGAGHLLGDADDVDSGSDDGAKVSNLVAYPRGGGDCDDVDLVGVEDGGGIGRDMDSEGIDAEHFADILTVQGRVDVDGPDVMSLAIPWPMAPRPHWTTRMGLVAVIVVPPDDDVWC